MLISLLWALTPEAMTPTQQLALALREQALSAWVQCQVDHDLWQGQVRLTFDLRDGGLGESEVVENTTQGQRFGKCLLRKLDQQVFPQSFTGQVELHLNLLDRALNARIDGGHWESWSVDGGPALEWDEYLLRPLDGRFLGRGDWVVFHENLGRIEDDLDQCWLQQQAVDPYIAGRVELRIRVRGTRARDIEIVTNTTGAEELPRCFSEAFEGVRFPPDLDGLALYPVMRDPPPGLEMRLVQWETLLGYLGHHCRGPHDDRTPAHRVDSRLAFTMRKGEVRSIEAQAGTEEDLSCIQEHLTRFRFREDTSGRFVVTVPLLHGGEVPPDPQVPEPLARTVAAVYARLEDCIGEERPDGRMDVVVTLAEGQEPGIEVLRDGTGVPALGPCFTTVLEQAPWPAMEGRWVYPFFFDFQ